MFRVQSCTRFLRLSPIRIPVLFSCLQFQVHHRKSIWFPLGFLCIILLYSICIWSELTLQTLPPPSFFRAVLGLFYCFIKWIILTFFLIHWGSRTHPTNIYLKTRGLCNPTTSEGEQLQQLRQFSYNPGWLNNGILQIIHYKYAPLYQPTQNFKQIIRKVVVRDI